MFSAAAGNGGGMKRSGPVAVLRRGAATIAVSAAAAGLVVAVPWAAGTSWRAVTSLGGGIDPRWALALLVVWMGGLLANSLVLTASMPGLGTRQALSLNLAGSAVANAVPLGGPTSMALTTAMARSWGFGRTRIGAFLTVSTVWTAAGRTVAGLLALVLWMLATPGPSPARSLVVALLPVGVAAIALVAAVGNERRAAAVARAVGGLLDRLAGRRGIGPEARVCAEGKADGSRAEQFAAAVVAARRLSLEVSRRSWRQLAFGQTAYLMLLALLLDGCLRALGHPVSPMLVVAAMGIERLVVAVPITPGGAGIAELGLVSVLGAAGMDPTTAAAAALLYRLFTFGLEIPVGGAVALGWALGRRRRRAARSTRTGPHSAPIATRGDLADRESQVARPVS
jgi:uncharacterized membrane protein YbhN (UPF0104 family)